MELVDNDVVTDVVATADATVAAIELNAETTDGQSVPHLTSASGASTALDGVTSELPTYSPASVVYETDSNGDNYSPGTYTDIPPPLAHSITYSA